MPYISFRLSKQETEGLKEFLDSVGFDRKRDEIWVVKLDKRLKLYLLNNKLPLLFEMEGLIFPTVVSAKLFKGYYSEAVVDKGAVPHILNGADLMAPGVVSFRLEGSNGIVIITSEEGSVLAIGRLVEGFREALDKRHGKVAENIHHVNDKLYQILVSKYNAKQFSDRIS